MKKRFQIISFTFILIGIFICSMTNAQVVYDNNGSSESCVDCGNPYTRSNYTVAAGTNRILVVSLGWLVSWTPNSITYNGQTLTQAVAQWESSYAASEIWYVVLGTGSAITGDIVIDFSVAPKTVIGVSTFQNVNQTNPISNTAAQRVLNNNITTSITSSTNNAIVDCLTSFSKTSYSMQAGQTKIFEGLGVTKVFGSYKPALANSTSMAWNNGVFNSLLHSLVELQHDGVTFLPVELTDFKGKNINNQNHLTWQTASERNNEGFFIEKSVNGTDWEEIGFVQGNGTTTEVSDYEFIDNEPFEGNNYYRLKQIDFDGKFEYSDVLNIEYRTGNIEYRIFPNPTSDVINVEITAPTLIQIFNSNGQLMLEKSISNTERIDISNLPAGVYWLKPNNGESQTFIKQ